MKTNESPWLPQVIIDAVGHEAKWAEWTEDEGNEFFETDERDKDIWWTRPLVSVGYYVDHGTAYVALFYQYECGDNDFSWDHVWPVSPENVVKAGEAMGKMIYESEIDYLLWVWITGKDPYGFLSMSIALEHGFKLSNSQLRRACKSMAWHALRDMYKVYPRRKLAWKRLGYWDSLS